MTAYSPDPDRRDPPPLAVIAGYLVLVGVAVGFVFGGAALIVALFDLFAPVPLPPA